METIKDILAAIIPTCFMIIADLQMHYWLSQFHNDIGNFSNSDGKRNLLLSSTSIWSCMFSKSVYKDCKSSSVSG